MCLWKTKANEPLRVLELLQSVGMEEDGTNLKVSRSRAASDELNASSESVIVVEVVDEPSIYSTMVPHASRT